MNRILAILLPSLFFQIGNTQSSFEFEGQASAIASFSPHNDRPFFLGLRYIPDLNLSVPLSESKAFDFEGAINFDASVFPGKNAGDYLHGKVSPYRLWARYSAKKFELRLGLQKIDFGSSTLLRPMQWFNQVDPRDPLQLTNGVYGLLGRYYFANNANIWFWTLYGNSKPRGFDLVETNPNVPEFGGRFQTPVPKGELAISFHHRTASTVNTPFLDPYETIPENRLGLDGKWDLGVGLWFETTYNHKGKDVDVFTHQTLVNVGADYTFGLGNGLNLILEHLLIGYDSNSPGFEQNSNFTALTASYPLSFYDNISSILYYNWAAKSTTFFLNYQHQFGEVSCYFMAYYNPSIQGGVQQNDLVNNFSGPGLRIMAVYNH